jgi:hypothetical protein
MNQTEIILKLGRLLSLEHTSQCDSATCDINAAYDHRLFHWAIELFSGSGASSVEFDKLYNRLGPKFHKDAEKERQELCKECPHCNAVLWLESNPEADESLGCDSCGKGFTPRPIPISISIQAKKWFDSVNGNTYHSAEVSVLEPGADSWIDIGRADFTYGYGEQYRQTAREIIDHYYNVHSASHDSFKDLPMLENVHNVKRRKDLI